MKTMTPELSDTRRGLLSLAIFVHLFCVGVGLLANESTSELMVRIRQVLGPYTRLLNVDPQFAAGFQLTHAMPFEDDHELVIEAADGSITRLPQLLPGWRRGLGFRQQRWLQLTKQFGMYVDSEDDQSAAELCRAMGTAHLATSNDRQLVVRCERIWPLELDPSSQPEPTDPVLYQADVIRDARGIVRVHKQVDPGEAAPVRRP